jgi:vitamin B12 transporter
LYGSDAVAGVINIITKKAAATGAHVDVAAAAGSYGTFKGNVGYGLGTKRSRLSLQYGYNSSNGFSSAHDSTSAGAFDRDGFKQHSVTGNWQVTITDDLTANVFGFYSWYKTAIDGSAFNDEKDYNVTTDNIQTGAGLTYKLGAGNVQLNYRYNKVNRLYLDDSVFSAPNYLRVDYMGATHFSELYATQKWNNVELIAGVDYRRNSMTQDLLSISSFGPYTAKLDDSVGRMSQVSPYASLVFKAGDQWNFEAGGRLNSHSEYGTNFSYTINPSVFINNKVKAFLNLYSAYKAPTLFELFDPLYGNKELEPETSFNLEAGSQWFINKELNVRGVYFYRNTNDAIEFIYTDPQNYISQYRNISNKKARGFELEAEYRSAKWNASANYTYTTGELTSPYDNTGFPVGKDTTINNLFRVPESVLNVSVGRWLMRKLYASTQLRVAGDRLEPIYAGAPVILDSYYSWDVYAEYRFSKKLRLFADFRNITDQQYFEILGYNTRGFNFMGGLQVSL